MHPLGLSGSGIILFIEATLIKNQDVNTRYFGSHPPFRMVFKMSAKDKMLIWCNISLLLSVLSRPSILRSSLLFLILKAKH